MVDDRAKILAIDSAQLTVGLSYVPRDLKLGTRYVLELREWKPRRSLSQNAIWHAIIGRIAHETGNDADGVKAYLKESYGLKERVFGELVTKPSHRYDISEWPMLMEPAIALAGEYGVDIRDIIG